MNTTENNKLIAKFLGYSQPHPDYPETTYWYKKEQPPLTILSFDTDWNWLMEVVEKCFATKADYHLHKLIEDALISSSGNRLEKTYNAVITFINEYQD